MEERPENDMPPSTDKLNELLERLKFSKEETKSYEFWLSPFWLRVYNFPIELMACQTAMDVGNALGELIAIDWKDRFGGWTEFMRLKVKMDVSKPLRRVVKLVDKEGVETIGVINWLRAPTINPNQERGLKRNRVELIKQKTQMNDDKEESQTNSRDENGQPEYKGKEKSYEEESLSISPMDRRNQKTIRDGMGRFKSKRKRQRALPRAMKIFSWNCRGVGNPVIVRELKQLLVANCPDVIFLCET
ncbi:hypothetical protein Gotur_014105 [Gossypium turneri]